MEKIKSSLSEIKDQLEAMRVRHFEEKIRARIEPNSSASSQRHANALKTRVTRWNTPLSNYLGAGACLIISKVNGESRYKAFLRWRTLCSIVLNGSISSACPSWLSWPLYSRFTFQHVVSVHSLAVEACGRNDLLLMRELLSTGNAHPNDTTTENHTLLHVCAHRCSVTETLS
jgi:hypothetical protein